MKPALRFAVLIATSAAMLAAMADMSADIGKWSVRFREGDASLKLENRATCGDVRWHGARRAVIAVSAISAVRFRRSA